MIIIKFFCTGFQIGISRVKAGNKKFWSAKIFDKNKNFVKQFYDTTQEHTKIKALEWVESKKQYQKI
ncbi:MAG: hypothetical protein SFW07_06640 [Gammaproteobacteria bacterium]|nr:hypothetical protein [Gammaproteobacteria bacterium]